MSSSLSFLDDCRPGPNSTVSLGESFAAAIQNSLSVNTLLDCLIHSPRPAILSPQSSRLALTHDELSHFVSNFFLPTSKGRQPLGPNDRVMLVLPMGSENALALLSIAAYHTCAPINSSCTSSELREDALRLKIKAIVTMEGAEERLDLLRLCDELDSELIYVKPNTHGPAGLFTMSLASGNELSPRLSPSRLHELGDTSLVLHTSGTSGKKKVVPYTLLSLIVGSACVVHSWELRETDINMNMMPLFHVGGIVRNLLSPLISGGSTIMCSGFDPIAFWSLALEYKATWYYAAPTIHHAILSSRPKDVNTERDIHIRMIANAAGGLLPSLAKELSDTFVGAVVLPSYGMTECMPIASPPPNYRLERPGCSGIACGPHLSVRNPSDLEVMLPRGKTGAICVRGIPTFEGYEISVDAPLDKSMLTQEGWFDSGDVGYLDEDGYLFITGRSKEIINKGGEVISPFEIEEAVATAAKSYVKAVLAFSVEHDVFQEAVGIMVVPEAGVPHIGLSQLHDVLRHHLHPSKWPSVIVYINELPKNSAGKVLRIGLASRLGLPSFTDSIPVLRRHFNASISPVASSLQVPLVCSLVSVDLAKVESVMKHLDGVHDCALRFGSDSTLEAFVHCTTEDGSIGVSIKQKLAETIPGYFIPERVHCFGDAMPCDSAGAIDFATLEQLLKEKASLNMTERELEISRIIASVLGIASNKIASDSDFFLLGGSSLLLGQLTYHIRKKFFVSLDIPSLFLDSTVAGISLQVEALEERLRDEKQLKLRDSFATTASGAVTLVDTHDDSLEGPQTPSRGQTHPLVLIVQAVPLFFFYPLRVGLTWTILLYTLSYFAAFLEEDFWPRLGALLGAIIIARMAARVACPVFAIIIKWVVIGRYKPGIYKMWSGYHLRWWIVNQALRAGGRGIFAMHPALELLYYRLLGARIGKNVIIDPGVRMGEYDLITIEDDCKVDRALVRGFCVETDGYFRLDKIIIERNAVVNTYTSISPGAVIPEGSVYGPHASSHDPPSPPANAMYNRAFIPAPHWYLKVFIAWPIITLVTVASYVPWMFAIWLMIDQTVPENEPLNSLGSVIRWFALPERVLFHLLSRAIRASVTPLLHLALALLVKRALGLNKVMPAAEATQMSHLRRYINSVLLSQEALGKAFNILGTHYGTVSVVFRAMGAKIGQRIYWPGSGIYCLDPEMLEIGNDVVFGSRSEFFTTDGLGTDKIIIEDGAMIADRVVLPPGTRIGRQTVMGSGALGKRNQSYEAGTTWIGSSNGEAICLTSRKAGKEVMTDTITPFGKAFHLGKANYTVFPYVFVLLLNFVITITSALYWSLGAITTAQILDQIHLNLSAFHLFQPRVVRFFKLYGLVSCCFVLVLTLQALLALFWVILTKWLVIGRRKTGNHSWDISDYCQRWQIHLTLSRLLHDGYGNGGVLAPITGSAYIVWYLRALGAKIGENCAVFAGGRVGLMTEPDLVQLGDYVNLDDCSVVAHINTRGIFSLNQLKVGDCAALRSTSRLLSGGSMEEHSMLCEHTLLTSGEVAEAEMAYAGWPAKPFEKATGMRGKQTHRNRHQRQHPSDTISKTMSNDDNEVLTITKSRKNDNDFLMIVCPLCQKFPKNSVATSCGHLFCFTCIKSALQKNEICPICKEATKVRNLNRIQLVSRSTSRTSTLINHITPVSTRPASRRTSLSQFSELSPSQTLETTPPHRTLRFLTSN